MRRLLAALACCLALALPAAAQDSTGSGPAEGQPSQANQLDPSEVFSPREQAAFKQLIEDHLLANPELLERMVAKLKKQKKQARQAQAQDAIAANRAALVNDPNAPVAGNPEGDVTIVEFFDYNCGYCRKLMPRLMDMVAEDGDIRLVFKEYPILAKSSAKAARAALAVHEAKPSAYPDFHKKLMKRKAKPTDKLLAELAQEVGVDPQVVRTALQNDRFNKQLKANVELARKLGISGTPAMVIGDQLITGAVPTERIARAVAQAREQAQAE